MPETRTEKVVYFVRHGQSVDNAAPVFQSPDSPLTEKGRRQVESVAERVSRLSFGSLVSSPLQRAKETAEAIERLTGKRAEFLSLFAEVARPSRTNGKPYEDEKANAAWREWQRSLYTSGVRMEDGENLDDLLIRADAALAFLTEREEETLVVVTHGYFLRTIVARVLLGDSLSGEALRRFQRSTTTENTGLTVLRYQGGFEDEPRWRLWIYNDHAHLG